MDDAMEDAVRRDRALIRKAALAVGYEVARLADDKRALILFGVHKPWSPLDSDADVFRLATIVPGIDVTKILANAFVLHPNDEGKRAERVRRAITEAVAARADEGVPSSAVWPALPRTGD